MVETPVLERPYARNGIEGSNPSLSATIDEILISGIMQSASWRMKVRWADLFIGSREAIG